MRLSADWCCVIVDYNPRHFPEPNKYKPSRWYGNLQDLEAMTAFSIGQSQTISSTAFIPSETVLPPISTSAPLNKPIPSSTELPANNELPNRSTSLHRPQVRRHRSRLLPHAPPPGLACRARSVFHEARRNGGAVEGEDDEFEGVFDVGTHTGAGQVGEEGEVRFEVWGRKT